MPDMKRVTWVLAVLFGLAFLGSTLLHASLVLASRKALADIVLNSSEDARGALYHVAVVLPDTEDSFFDGLAEGMIESAAAAGAALHFMRYPESDPERADRHVETAMRAGLDGLVIYASPGRDWVPLAERASREGLPFVPLGRDPPSGGLDGFIGASTLMLGLEAGKIIGQRLGASARVGVLLPPEGRSGYADEPLYRGVAASLSAYGSSLVVAAQRAGRGVLSGEEAASSMLRSDPSINAIVCTSSADTVGAAQAVIDMNRVGKVLIVGADETPDIARYLERGVLAASLVVDSRWMGGQAMAAFSRIRAGGRPGDAVEAGFSARQGARP